MRVQLRNPFAYKPLSPSKGSNDPEKSRLKPNVLKKRNIIRLVLAIIIIIIWVTYQSSNGNNNTTSTSKDQRREKHSLIPAKETGINYKNGKFSKFPTLLEALPHAEMIVIYFAAAWSKECDEVTQDLDEAFSYYEFLLSPLDLLNIELGLPEAKDVLNKRKNLAIIFVSSGKSSVLEDADYGSEEWLHLSRQTDEGTLLKRFFHTSAKKEEKKLKVVNRKFDIPHMIVIDAITQEILTEDGIKDIKENAPHAYEIWKELRK